MRCETRAVATSDTNSGSPDWYTSTAAEGSAPQGTFTRQLFLGEMLDAARIEANYSDGVLTLTIPVAKSAKPRRVQVTESGGSSSIDTDSSPT
jgi:HSP20 family protein